ncbi:precorrin-6y C5,15-methyltransferase (decarboxylating) subunit CbiE [Microcoleus sp. FACHB-672]|uniref:precorrin-6y C5,15-methyltransferase (decarboxylating) subunit CbiE n=1 Tax=Microcoleus sp. FACHB-672 TaxID=2692825 RepID=UPI0016860BD4|nr:precorrin-6y C5,15-methyltransferase (decarboxylating) subunit CbiE [Microcoleus sp. FACHB-672]MBD2040025.1 precorrin-6y C5,15-methyltransferase (decarboxylating) subunit CbiE [Microcoleus sp. FACHB-672]
MVLVHVVGIGLDGVAGLTLSVQHLVEKATLLVGSERHLGYFPNHQAERLVIGDLNLVIRDIRKRLSSEQPESVEENITADFSSVVSPPTQIVVLVSGDPLFFGLGRLLLEELPADKLIFHPHLSSVQLAFNRLKVPWQDARVISAHGRSVDELLEALRQGVEKIAVLTDGTHNPSAIARLLLSLDLPSSYELWVCENLGGANERVQGWPALDPAELARLQQQHFEPLNVVVLLRRPNFAQGKVDVKSLPILGLPDHTFVSFNDRPGLMTKREVRILVLGELALQSAQTIWDVGAGTGSVSIEMARLCPNTQIYAIEKTAVGTTLIEQNCRRLGVTNVVSINGSAPEILYRLPAPDRIFIGGTGGQLRQILGVCGGQLKAGGVMVLALATLEHLNDALIWVNERMRRERDWSHRLLQVQLSRSVPIGGQLTRLSPLNPVTIVTVSRR